MIAAVIRASLRNRLLLICRADDGQLAGALRRSV